MRCPVCESPLVRDFVRADARDYLRCEACLATFVHPAQRPSAEAERACYALHRNALDDPGYRAFLSRLATPLLARLSPARRGLDYGCGPGPLLAEMLREAGHEVALFDPFFFPEREVLSRRYGFITCTEVVEHFHRPAEELARLAAMLEPGGWLAIMTTFQTDDARFVGWHYRRDPTHVVFYREETLRRVADRHGLSFEVPAPNVALMRKARES